VIGLSVVASTGNIYAGLYYPMIVASITFVVGSLLMRETHGHRIWEEIKIETGELETTREAGDEADDMVA
jgi:hypothetical protein